MPYETVRLITTGARTGLERGVEIWAHERPGGWFVVGSNWGRPHQAGWYHNLRADASARVEPPGGGSVTVLARVAEGAERERLFARALADFPGYADLVTRAGARPVPVVVLERSSGPLALP